MSFCRIEPDYYSEFGIITNPTIPSASSFLDGVPITETLPNPLLFEVNDPDSVPPGHFLGDEIPVVSKRFIDGLRANGVDNFQVFPAQLKSCVSDRQYGDYCAFNVVGSIDAVDTALSQSQVIMGDNERPPLVDFETLSFSASKVGDFQMFRLVQSPVYIYLATRILDSMDSDKPAEGWGISAQVIDLV